MSVLVIFSVCCPFLSLGCIKKHISLKRVIEQLRPHFCLCSCLAQAPCRLRSRHHHLGKQAPWSFTHRTAGLKAYNSKTWRSALPSNPRLSFHFCLVAGKQEMEPVQTNTWVLHEYCFHATVTLTWWPQSRVCGTVSSPKYYYIIHPERSWEMFPPDSANKYLPPCHGSYQEGNYQIYL